MFFVLLHLDTLILTLVQPSYTSSIFPPQGLLALPWLSTQRFTVISKKFGTLTVTFFLLSQCHNIRKTNLAFSLHALQTVEARFDSTVAD